MSTTATATATATGVASWRWTIASMVLVTAFFAAFVRVGGDWDWLVALGEHVRAEMQVPDGVPFAASDTAGWHNVPVLAQLVATVVNDLGEQATVLAHVGVVVVAMYVLARTARSGGASDRYTAGALIALGAGALATLGVVRAQTLSLVPFALLLALVASQVRHPDRRIWWAVPLIAVWGNLHGAALLGACVLGAYLVVERVRSDFWLATGVGVSSLLALCATPELWRTPTYYATVFDNVSAQRGEGLWAKPSLDMPFDVVMLVSAVVLLVLFLRARRRPWEYVAVLGLCLATASAARHGTWLLMLLVVLAGNGRAEGTRPAEVRASRRPAGLAALVVGIPMAVALPIVVVRGDAVLGAPPDVVDVVAQVAGDSVVLAPAPLSESLAVAGVTLWAGNPLDAFSHRVQAAYLDFLDGDEGAAAAVAGSDVVVAQEGSAQADLVSGDPAFEPRDCGGTWICFVRR